VEITVNEKLCQVRDEITLVELVGQLGLVAERVAIELNRDVVPRALWTKTILSTGDRLEIVHFVGGG
jgi:thiamine biosynthesis protein ThiS